MSSAFDTIDRQILLNTLQHIVNTDEHTIIQYLLANTTLNISCNTLSTSITTNIGTPQGDSISPILFIVYLEAALRELRPKLSPSTFVSPNELIYADDCDIIFDTRAEAESSVPIIVESLKAFNLQVNASKTEFTTVDRTAEDWKKLKKIRNSP